MIKSNAKLHLHKFWVGFDAVFIRKRKGGNWFKEEILLGNPLSRKWPVGSIFDRGEGVGEGG